MATEQGNGDAAEESLFKAYFTEGKNIADKETLTQLGIDIGLDATAVKQVLEGNAYAQNVQQDIAEAATLGVRGVPFFVIDRKYAVSGAQATEVFHQALETAYTEWKKENVQFTTIQGEVCSTDGDCK
jgi:predicted DsbA family dithiol-disulfide isomerase